MIEVKNLSKFYGPTKAVENVSFTVGKGEILGLLGPNGAGKTTIMRILTGYFQPTSGSVKIAGFDVVEEPLEVKKRIGYMQEGQQGPALYYEMTVSSFLSFAAEIKGTPKKDRSQNILKAMELAGIKDVRHRIIGRLSSGYKQRVGLAQALLNDPEILILDEPTRGLDPKQIIEIRQLIKNMAGERTIILSSHILPEVSMTCGKIVIIDKGEKVAEDTQAELAKKLEGGDRVVVKIKGKPDAGEVTKEFKKIKNLKEVRVEAEGNSTRIEVVRSGSKDIREDLFATAVENNWIILEMKSSSLSLEEVFLRLTTREDV
ncbi:MAG: ABC transporter ATP-binding protein [Candidatus Firestonebacteria bacterium]|nr:ABC transporter ATP-binding protein [Candidatus Firestonebacteria bacterium]